MNPCKTYIPFTCIPYRVPPFTPPSAPGRLLPSRLALINQLIKGVKWANQLVSGISTSEDRRKERTRGPPNFWEGGTGGPACETSLNGLKAGMGRGAHAPPIVWEGGGGTGDPAYVRHLWVYNMPARIGGRRGHVLLPTFERGAQIHNNRFIQYNT